MVRRRLGKSFLDYAVNPFILGIYAGDPDYLIPKYALPKLYRLEQTYGSFIGGSMKKKKAERHNNLAQRVTRDVFSVKGGLENLVHALVDSIGEENILTGIDNLSADRVKSGYLLSGSHDKADDVLISADHVVSTTGPYEYKTLFPFLEADELAVLNNLLYARVVQVTVGFEQWNGAAIDAFGGLVPSKENRKVLGILFPSSCFNGRAPKGGALFSVFAGGIKHPEIVDLTDNELVKLVSEEFCSMMKIHAFNPDFIKIHRYSHAIPQYGISSRERLEMIQNVQHKYPGLHLGGNIQEGIGMADRIKQGTDISNHILSFNQML
jgi:oxygen-dependent protoporphyrinogen oxidase